MDGNIDTSKGYMPLSRVRKAQSLRLWKGIHGQPDWDEVSGWGGVKIWRGGVRRRGEGKNSWEEKREGIISQDVKQINKIINNNN